MEENESYGQLIKELREKRAWTQEQLAGAANVSPRTVQRIEGGEKPASETLMSLADAFGIEASALKELAKAKLPKTVIPSDLDGKTREMTYQVLDQVSLGQDLLRIVFLDDYTFCNCDALRSPEETETVGSLFDELRLAPRKFGIKTVMRGRPYREILEYGVELTKTIHQVENAGFLVFAGALKQDEGTATDGPGFSPMPFVYVARSSNSKIVRMTDGHNQLPVIRDLGREGNFKPLLPNGFLYTDGFVEGVKDTFRPFSSRDHLYNEPFEESRFEEIPSVEFLAEVARDAVGIKDLILVALLGIAFGVSLAAGVHDWRSRNLLHHPVADHVIRNEAENS